MLEIESNTVEGVRPLLEPLLAHAPVPVFVLTGEGDESGCLPNEEAARLVAKLDVEPMGLLPTQAVALHRQALASGESFTDLDHLVEGRALKWVCQADPGANRTVWYGQEVTERWLAEARLRADQARYRLLTESSTDLISRHSKDGTFLYASQAARRLLGFEPEELIGVSAYDLFHPDDLRALLRKDPSIFHDRGFYQQTYRIRCKDGSYVWFETTSRTYRDESGQLLEILCVSRDVSRRVRMEAARERLARVVESTTDYVLFADSEETVFYRNEAARQRLCSDTNGGNAERPLRLGRFYSARSLHRLRYTVLPLVRTSGSWNGELEMRDASGASVPVLAVVLCHVDRHQGGEHFQLLNRDISERKTAEMQAHAHQQQIAHANRLAATGELASGIVHEVNQPLAAIANYASGILKRVERRPDAPAAEMREPLEKLEAQVQRASTVLRRIRNFVRKGQIRRKSLDLGALLKDAQAQCQWQASEHGVEMYLQVPADLPPAEADPIHLQQVVVNLVLNAVDASKDVPPERRRIEIRAWSHGRASLAFGIRDFGPGLGHEEPERIFETFYTTKSSGLGMGLPISRSILEALGGQLWVEQPADGGCRFVGTLCVAQGGPRRNAVCRNRGLEERP